VINVPKDNTAEMPEITAYSMTYTGGHAGDPSSAGPMFEENLGRETFQFGKQAQIQVWPDVDQETKLEFEKKYDEHQSHIAEELQREVFEGHEATILAVDELDEEEEDMKKRALRVVQIFIADRHPDVPLESAIIYSSPKPFATDMTNQELYFTINIMELLKEHNEFRVELKDREATKRAGKEVMLEEIRISDLDMQVTAFTEFGA
jgi:hypothetical protein